MYMSGFAHRSRPGSRMSDRATRDRLAATYSSYAGLESARWSRGNRGNRSMMAERTVAAEGLMSLAPLAGQDVVLDLGSGASSSVCPAIDSHRGLIVPCDLLHERLVSSSSANARLCSDGTRLPLASASVTLVVTFTVFSSVLDERDRQEMANEVSRVLRPGGHVLFYDMRWPNPSNRGLRRVTQRRLSGYFPDYSSSSRSLTMVPQLARRLGPFARLYDELSVGVLHSHRIALLQKPNQ